MAEAGESLGGRTAQPAGRLGLVELQTSPTEIQIDPVAERMRRMRKGVDLAVSLAPAAVHKPGHRAHKAWMLTLTYAEPDAWQPCHISGAIKCLDSWANRKGIAMAGVWVAEMQEKRFHVRGESAVHYHVLVWLPVGVTPPKPDKQGWWRHGMTKREAVKKSAGGYIAKYASKGGTVPFPKGVRIHGHFGLRSNRRAYTYFRRPTWLRDRTISSDRLRRFPGGGWVNLGTGERLRSPWRARYCNGIVYLRRIEEWEMAALVAS